MPRKKHRLQSLYLNFPIFSRSRSKEAYRTTSQSAVNRPQSADRKQIVISLLEEQGQAKTADFVQAIGLSNGRVRDLLRTMVNDGTIEKIGTNRYAYYVLKR